MELIRCPIPQDDQIMNLSMDTERNRDVIPVRNPLELTAMTGPEPMSLLRRELSPVEEVGQAQIVLTEPGRCQATVMEVEGAVTDTIASIPYRCCDCGIQMTTGLNSAIIVDNDRNPRPIRTYPARPGSAPVEGETVISRSTNFLDVPALRLPGVFLKLAEEARNSEVVRRTNHPIGAQSSHTDPDRPDG